MVADERTATHAPDPSAAYPDEMADATESGSGAATIRSRNAAATRAIAVSSAAGRAWTDARSAPSGSIAASAAANAPVVTTNPGGTATPARASSPRLAPFPPASAAFPAAASSTT